MLMFRDKGHSETVQSPTNWSGSCPEQKLSPCQPRVVTEGRCSRVLKHCDACTELVLLLLAFSGAAE